jgi:hypothetical protein
MLRLPVHAILDDLVGRAGLHAMRHRQHQCWRNQRAGAEIAARADDGDDRAADAIGRWRAAADDGVGGCGKQQRGDGDYPEPNFHRRSNSPQHRDRQEDIKAIKAGPRWNAVLAVFSIPAFEIGGE